jgi:hypothetical protein
MSCPVRTRQLSCGPRREACYPLSNGYLGPYIGYAISKGPARTTVEITDALLREVREIGCGKGLRCGHWSSADFAALSPSRGAAGRSNCAGPASTARGGAPSGAWQDVVGPSGGRARHRLPKAAPIGAAGRRFCRHWARAASASFWAKAVAMKAPTTRRHCLPAWAKHVVHKVDAAALPGGAPDVGDGGLQRRELSGIPTRGRPRGRNYLKSVSDNRKGLAVPS